VSGWVQLGGVGSPHPSGRFGTTVLAMSIDVVMIGGGNMGAALLGGMISSEVFDPSSLAVVERLDARRVELAQLFPRVSVLEEVPACAAAVIAVKPDGVSDAVALAVAGGARRVLSIAAGVTIAALEAVAGPNVAVIRAMPNTPALVGKGVAAISGGASTDEGDLVWAAQILGSVGIVERLEEPLLQGLAYDVAERVVAQLLLGAATLLDRDRDPAQLRVNVTSPGGTTAAGLARFEAHGFRSIVADVVNAATERSQELG
jgi:pyrroline-5-carboxylate reductase